MQLHELRKEVAESDIGYWHRIDHGPLYRHTYVEERGRGITQVHYMESRWVMRHDLDISLEYGMPGNLLEIDDKEFTADWAPFANRSVSYDLVDIFYRNALVDRLPMASVDGGRCILPYPDATPGGWATSPWRYDIARLLSELHGMSGFEDYFRRSGITSLPRL